MTEVEVEVKAASGVRRAVSGVRLRLRDCGSRLPAGGYRKAILTDALNFELSNKRGNESKMYFSSGIFSSSLRFTGCSDISYSWQDHGY